MDKGRPKTVLIHIGTPKTGSTSIQWALARASKTGGLGHVRYPLWRSDRNHARLATIYWPYGELWRWWRADFPADNRRFRRMRRQFRGFIHEEWQSAESMILSSEGLSKFTNDHVRRLRDDLELKGFRRFHIVLYIRDPAGAYLSTTQQLLKGVHETQPVKDPRTYRYGFLQVAETWERVFPGSMLVRKFSDGKDDDVVADFSSLLEQHLGVELPSLGERLNTTISAEGMQILQDYREAFGATNDGLLAPDAVRLAQFLRQSEADVPQTRPELRPDIASLIRANHYADAQTIRTRYGVDLGLSDRSAEPNAPQTGCRVDEILTSVDPAIVHRLLLTLAWRELQRTPSTSSLLMRRATALYRRIPIERGPSGLDRWLRALADHLR